MIVKVGKKYVVYTAERKRSKVCDTKAEALAHDAAIFATPKVNEGGNYGGRE